MSVLRRVKLRTPDGTESIEYPLGVEAKNVEVANGENLSQRLARIDEDLENNEEDIAAVSELAGTNKQNIGANEIRIDALERRSASVDKKPYYFNTVADMKAYQELKAGDMVITLGYYSPNDGGGATYLIREKTSSDVEDGGSIHFVNGLVAELLVEGKINVKKLGVKGNDESVDNGEILNNIIPNLPSGTTLVFPLDYYYFKTSINSVMYLKYEGEYNYDYASVTSRASLIFDGCNGFIECNKNKFKNLIIQSTLTENKERQWYGIYNAKTCNGSYIEHCTIFNWNVGIHGNRHAMFINNCNIHHNNHGVAGLVDARVINNTINANFKDGVYLFPSCNDNIISNNKVEWNGESGIYSYSSEHNMITNNICDRNGIDGIHVSTCNYCNINGNLLRRNGITSTGDKNTQILLLNCNNISLSGNITKTGYIQDYEQGDIVPLHGITIENCNDIFSAGNNWKGGTESDVVILSSTENIFMFDSSYNAQEYLEGIAKSYSLPVGESTIEVDGNIAQGSMPICDKFMIYGRDNNYWSYVYQEILLSNFRLSNKDSSTEAKCNISDITDKVKITNITFNRDTGKYIITINNTNTIVFHLYFKPIYV